MTSSPSAIQGRVSPLGSLIASLPWTVISAMQARLSSVGPDTVPVPRRSPGSRLQPLLAWWVTICATVQ
jgi:hypothetical protein